MAITQFNTIQHLTPTFQPTRFGAEALSPEAEREAEDNEWRLAKYFSMQLHPDDLKVKHSLMPYRK